MIWAGMSQLNTIDPIDPLSVYETAGLSGSGVTILGHRPIS